jgi:hypothetical protein
VNLTNLIKLSQSGGREGAIKIDQLKNCRKLANLHLEVGGKSSEQIK